MVVEERFHQIPAFSFNWSFGTFQLCITPTIFLNKNNSSSIGLWFLARLDYVTRAHEIDICSAFYTRRMDAKKKMHLQCTEHARYECVYTCARSTHLRHACCVPYFACTHNVRPADIKLSLRFDKMVSGCVYTRRHTTFIWSLKFEKTVITNVYVRCTLKALQKYTTVYLHLWLKSCTSVAGKMCMPSSILLIPFHVHCVHSIRPPKIVRNTCVSCTSHACLSVPKLARISDANHTQMAVHPVVRESFPATKLRRSP